MSSSELNLDESLLIPLEEIQLATENFRSEIQIEYNFVEPLYKVYRGQLSERWQNRTAAIKRCKAASVVGEENFQFMRKMFLKEIEVASGFHNESIIPFVGYCDDGNEMILVYEYAICGCLAHFLADADKRRHITWAQRLQICIGVATGLEYLHTGFKEDNGVIHSQVNSSTIWLNDNMDARISDFAWSILVPKNQSQVCGHVVGNGYYADPVYREGGIAKTEIDVYSLGVVMFELLTGMLVYNERSIGDVEPQMMIRLVRRYYDVGLDNIIDPHIKDQIDRLSLHMFKELAFRCISLNIKERPTMSIIVNTIKEALDIHENYLSMAALKIID